MPNDLETGRDNSKSFPEPLRKAGADTARFYRPELDCLRFFAFAAVFACHGLSIKEGNSYHGLGMRLMDMVTDAGNFGVCLFFFLSSYLITELLRREDQKTGTIDLKAFYIRRLLRIWPLYFSVLIVVSVLGLIYAPLHLQARLFLSYILFAGNWYLLLSPVSGLALSWLWSISVEEQFYIIWPTMAKFGGMRAVAIGSGLCIPTAIAATAWVAGHRSHPDVMVWLNSFVQFQFFALGALLALMLAGRSPRLSVPIRVVMFVSASFCWFLASGYCLIKRPGVDPGAWKICLGYEWVAAGCLLLFLSVLGMSDKYLAAPLIYLGKISYGLYVFHGIALLATSALRKVLEQHVHSHSGFIALSLFASDRLTALALTISAAILSYQHLEMPFLRLKKRFTIIRSRSM